MDIKLREEWAGYSRGTTLHVLGPGEPITEKCVDRQRAEKLLELEIAIIPRPRAAKKKASRRGKE